MKTIGMIGGMSWESTVTYYQVANEAVKRHLGGLHSAKILLSSVDFAEIENFQRNGYWPYAGETLAAEAKRLEDAGADMVLICSNTMHKVAKQVEDAVSVPFVHIGRATASALLAEGHQVAGLLGTRYTMEEDFMRASLLRNGVETIIPKEGALRGEIHRIIFDELCQGKIVGRSRLKLLDAIDDMEARGATAIILGCTELGLIVEQRDTDLPLFDTTRIHAEEAVRLALEE